MFKYFIIVGFCLQCFFTGVGQSNEVSSETTSYPRVAVYAWVNEFEERNPWWAGAFRTQDGFGVVYVLPEQWRGVTPTQRGLRLQSSSLRLISRPLSSTTLTAIQDSILPDIINRYQINTAMFKSIESQKDFYKQSLISEGHIDLFRSNNNLDELEPQILKNDYVVIPAKFRFSELVAWKENLSGLLPWRTRLTDGKIGEYTPEKNEKLVISFGVLPSDNCLMIGLSEGNDSEFVENTIKQLADENDIPLDAFCLYNLGKYKN